MQLLRQSTAVDVRLGPFVDSTDGVTPETGITLGAADQAEVLKADGAATAAMAGTFAAVTGADGWYDYTLSTSDTNTIGTLELVVQDSSVCLPVMARFQVIEEAVYDALFASGAVSLATAAALATVDANVDAILVDTGTTLPASIATIDTNVDAILVDTGTTLDANISAIKAKTDSLTFTVANQVDSNAVAISGDATSADNLEAMTDGTGLTGDTFPATQAQVGAIGSASGGALNFEASTDNTSGAIKTVTFVGTQTGTFVNTEANDGSYHQIDHSGNAIDIIYQFSVGGSRTGIELLFTGYLNSSNDSIDVQAFDFVGSDWETRGTISGQNGVVDTTETFKLLTKHTGTSGADIGLVLIRFVCTAQSAPTLQVDELIISAISEGQSVGYSGGQVWIDTVDGTAGTESFVNGVADNPVLTLADAITISASVGLKRFYCSPDSTITFAESHTDEVWMGDGWTLALGGQDISQTHINHCNDVSGIGTTPTGEVHILDSHIGALTIGQAHLTRSSLSSTLTLSAAADYVLENCMSGIAGASAPVIDMGAAVGATNLAVRNWHGGLTINNLASGDVVTLDGVFGTITLNGADASVELRGIAKAVTNNLTGSPTVNDNTLKTTDIETIDTVVDAILDDTGTSGVVVAGTPDVNVTQISGSATAADNLEASALGIHRTTVASGTSTTVFTMTDGSTRDDTYIGRVVVFTSGTIAGEAAVVSDYVGSTKTITLNTALTGIPSGNNIVIV